ncbi:MAG: hypothetical protein ACO1OO_13890 [Flavisolibacter sp.]
MKNWRLLLLFSLFILFAVVAEAQCSICTRTAQQLGEKPARGLNAGILYLAATPFALIGFIAFRWWKRNRDV